MTRPHGLVFHFLSASPYAPDAYVHVEDSHGRVSIRNLFTAHHLHTTVNHTDLVQERVSDTLSHGRSIGISAHLSQRLGHSFQTFSHEQVLPPSTSVFSEVPCHHIMLQPVGVEHLPVCTPTEERTFLWTVVAVIVFRPGYGKSL